jgi:hypothetical protein
MAGRIFSRAHSRTNLRIEKVILYAVLDPDAIKVDSSSSQEMGGCIYTLLQGILENVCLGVDRAGRMELSYTATAIDAAKLTKSWPRVSVLLTELLKLKKRRFVQHNIVNPKIELLIKEIHAAIRADIIITNSERCKDLGSISTDVVEYIQSDFEQTRRVAFKDDVSLDKKDLADIEDFVRRCTYTSSRIVIIDKFIGKTNNTAAFLKGVMFIVENWLKWQPNGKKVELEIITEPFVCSGDHLSHEEKMCILNNNKQKSEELSSKMVKPIMNKYRKKGLSVKLYFKNDKKENKILHDRFMVTENGTFQLSRGFDLFNKDGSFCRQLINMVSLDHPHISDCFELSDAIAPICMK